MRIFILDEEKSLDFRQLLFGNPDMDLLGIVYTVQEAEQKLAVLIPDVILYHSRANGGEFNRLRTLATHSPRAVIIVLSEGTDVEYVRNCLKAGARDFMTVPIDKVTLQKAMEKAYQRNVKKFKQETLSVLLDRFTGQPKILAFSSSKGGVGKTTIAVNVAVALQRTGKRVVIVDLDLQMGDDSILLGLKARPNIADLARISSEELIEKLPACLQVHSSGISVLSAPEDLVSARSVTPELVRMIIHNLEKRFDFVVVDLAPSVNSFLFILAELASEYFLISTPNLAVIRSNRSLLNLLSDLGYDLKNVHHILNCFSVRNGLKVSDVDRILKAQIKLFIKQDYRFVERSINSSIPFVLMNERHPVSKAIYQIAEMISHKKRNSKSNL